MGVLKYLWGSTHEDVAALGRASHPTQPGTMPTPTAEERRQAQLAYLDRNGPRRMSEAGYAKAQALLKAAQDRPAGRTKTNKIKIKKTSAK